MLLLFIHEDKGQFILYSLHMEAEKRMAAISQTTFLNIKKLTHVK